MVVVSGTLEGGMYTSRVEEGGVSLFAGRYTGRFVGVIIVALYGGGATSRYLGGGRAGGGGVILVGVVFGGGAVRYCDASNSCSSRSSRSPSSAILFA